MFAGCAYLAVVIGYFASYGAALHISNDSQLQWLVTYPWIRGNSDADLVQDHTQSAQRLPCCYHLRPFVRRTRISAMANEGRKIYRSDSKSLQEPRTPSGSPVRPCRAGGNSDRTRAPVGGRLKLVGLMQRSRDEAFESIPTVAFHRVSAAESMVSRRTFPTHHLPLLTCARPLA